MPPTPDRRATRTASPPAAQPPRPASSPPAYKRPGRPAVRRTTGFQVSPLALWVGVAVVGVLLIASFEWGYSAGRWRAARRLERAQPEVATAPARTKPVPVPALVSKPRQDDPPRGRKAEPETDPDDLPPRRKRPSTPPPKVAEPEPPEKPAPAPNLDSPVAPPAVVPAPAAAPTFASDILPVFQAKCNNCHGGASRKGGLDLRTVAALTRGGNSGPGVMPGKPSASPVWRTIEIGQMPPRNRPQLTPAEKKLIRDWIAAGAK